MGGGILPVAIVNGKLKFLFGREAEDSKWGDFGGGREGNETQFETAIREGCEELDGFLGCHSILRDRVKKNMIGVIDTESLKTYVFVTEYDENLPIYFNNHHHFIKKKIPDKIGKNGLFEKSEIAWFTIDEMKKNRGKFRPFYKKVLDNIIKRSTTLLKLAKKSNQYIMRRNYNHNSQNNTRRKRGHLTKIRRKHSHLTKIRRKRSHLTRKKIRRKHKTNKNKHFRRKQTVRGKRRYIKQVGGGMRNYPVLNVARYSVNQQLDLDETGCETGIIKNLEASEGGDTGPGRMTIDVDDKLCTQGDLKYRASVTGFTDTWRTGTFYFNAAKRVLYCKDFSDNLDLRVKVTGVVDIPDRPAKRKNRFNVEHEKPNNVGEGFANFPTAVVLALSASNAADKLRWMNALDSQPEIGPTAAAAAAAVAAALAAAPPAARVTVRTSNVAKYALGQPVENMGAGGVSGQIVSLKADAGDKGPGLLTIRTSQSPIRLPVAAAPTAPTSGAAPAHVTMRTSNVAKYALGQPVENMGAGGVSGHIVSLNADAGDKGSGTLTIQPDF